MAHPTFSIVSCCRVCLCRTSRQTTHGEEIPGGKNANWRYNTFIVLKSKSAGFIGTQRWGCRLRTTHQNRLFFCNALPIETKNDNTVIKSLQIIILSLLRGHNLNTRELSSSACLLPVCLCVVLPLLIWNISSPKTHDMDCWNFLSESREMWLRWVCMHICVCVYARSCVIHLQQVQTPFNYDSVWQSSHLSADSQTHLCPQPRAPPSPPPFGNVNFILPPTHLRDEK